MHARFGDCELKNVGFISKKPDRGKVEGNLSKNEEGTRPRWFGGTIYMGGGTRAWWTLATELVYLVWWFALPRYEVRFNV